MAAEREAHSITLISWMTLGGGARWHLPAFLSLKILPLSHVTTPGLIFSISKPKGPHLMTSQVPPRLCEWHWPCLYWPPPPVCSHENHFLLWQPPQPPLSHNWFMCSAARSCRLCDPTDRCPPGSCDHGILQAKNTGVGLSFPSPGEIFPISITGLIQP